SCLPEFALKKTGADIAVCGEAEFTMPYLMAAIAYKKNFEDIKEGSDLSFVMCLDCGIKVVGENAIELQDKEPILAFFLLKLIEKLRTVGSVPALEVDKYLNFIASKK
ncbi:MAG: hypothetical protein Q8P29_02405, partial [Candidatus Levybacteria bacterium]|nr:hypothetical protein [Candidatus Levybacteria bacterium]